MPAGWRMGEYSCWRNRGDSLQYLSLCQLLRWIRVESVRKWWMGRGCRWLYLSRSLGFILSKWHYLSHWQFHFLVTNLFWICLFLEYIASTSIVSRMEWPNGIHHWNAWKRVRVNIHHYSIKSKRKRDNYSYTQCCEQWVRRWWWLASHSCSTDGISALPRWGAVVNSCELGPPYEFHYPYTIFNIFSGIPVEGLLPTHRGKGNSYSVNPPLPQGLSLNVQTGAITGMVNSEEYCITVEITLENEVGSCATSLKLCVFENLDTNSTSVDQLPKPMVWLYLTIAVGILTLTFFVLFAYCGCKCSKRKTQTGKTD